MKKVLRILGVTGIIYLASCSPKPYEVKREIVIEAPVEVVYAQVINHKNRGNWAPWNSKDPNMTRSYEGPESGVGAIYKWSGNDEVGTGTLEIIEARENEYIKSKLVFTEPWESEDVVEWTFDTKENGTKATWTTSGELPGMAAMFMDESMDEMLGPDFEKGLADLKSYCEENYSSEPEMMENAEETSEESGEMVSDEEMMEEETEEAEGM